jgi:hypothetical protein
VAESYANSITKMDNKSFFVVNCGAKKVESKKVNIDGSDDMFYRYKVNQLLIQVVGKGKMIKTMFLNNDEVARGLHLMPEYIPAYMGYEIGAQFKYENKKPERERAHISGEYTTAVLSDVLTKLIKEVVLCKHCKVFCLFLNIRSKPTSLNNFFSFVASGIEDVLRNKAKSSLFDLCFLW